MAISCISEAPSPRSSPKCLPQILLHSVLDHTDPVIESLSSVRIRTIKVSLMGDYRKKSDVLYPL